MGRPGVDSVVPFLIMFCLSHIFSIALVVPYNQSGVVVVVMFVHIKFRAGLLANICIHTHTCYLT